MRSSCLSCLRPPPWLVLLQLLVAPFALRGAEDLIVTRGPYAGQLAEVDHIVPLAIVPELDHLELLPMALNRQKSARVGERQLDYARRFQKMGVLKPGSLERVQAVFRPAGTADVELAVP